MHETKQVAFLRLVAEHWPQLQDESYKLRSMGMAKERDCERISNQDSNSASSVVLICASRKVEVIHISYVWVGKLGM